MEMLGSFGAPAAGLDYDLAAAREVQERLLRKAAPALRTLEVGGCYAPARSVGGDFYDFVEFGDGRVALTLGDVAGKGVSAALMMASLHSMLRSECQREEADLGAALERVNRVFFESTAPHHYATLFLGEYDDRTRTLRYVNCGHVPPLVVRADGSFRRLEATATVIGLFGHWECEVAKVHLEPVDLLLVSSDGVVEAVGDEDEEFGEGRLVEALRRLRHLPVGTMVRSLVGAVREFGGRQPWDDLTVVAARAK
jgi:sigma-B regulation protein RsbU (phosphoserine phosphatase)